MATRDLADGETTLVQGSAAKPYTLKNQGGIYSCSCPAWLNQSMGLEARTCKHLKKLRGEEVELARVGAFAGQVLTRSKAQESGGGGRKAAVAKETAPPVLLAHKWENDTDLTGWWMSEKLDGVRAYWDGQAFVSRLGNVYQAPTWFTEGLPDHPLDGELWVGRKLFQDTISIVRRFDKSDDWKKVSYVLFDAPAMDEPFEKRMEFLGGRFAKGNHPHAWTLEQQLCRGVDHLKEELARVEALGGEGLMMRQPTSRYVAGRSATLLKIKSFFDAEARVLGHAKGAGRHKGRLGALEVELPDGTLFSVGTGFSDAEREEPPAIGSIITFRYQELSKDGVPRFPSYVCVREDFAWPEKQERKGSGKSRAAGANPANPPGAARKNGKKSKKA